MAAATAGYIQTSSYLAARAPGSVGGFTSLLADTSGQTETRRRRVLAIAAGSLAGAAEGGITGLVLGGLTAQLFFNLSRQQRAQSNS